MKKKILIPLFLFAFCGMLGLSACGGNQGGDTPTPDPTPTPTPDPTPTPTPDPEPIGEKEFVGMEVLDNGHSTIYLGEKFTAEGYTIQMVYAQEDANDAENPIYTTVVLDKFNIDDSKVDYRNVGYYEVTITGRDHNIIASETTTIKLSDSPLSEQGIEHIYGIKATFNGIVALNSDKSLIKPSSVTLISTSGQYENGEIVTTESTLRSGYVLDSSFVDTTKIGTYPVYLSYEKSYQECGGVTVKVSTFFLVTVA